MWKIKHLLKKNMIFCTDLFVLPTTTLKIVFWRQQAVVRAKDHNGRDKHYHLVKHAIDNKYLL